MRINHFSPSTPLPLPYTFQCYLWSQNFKEDNHRKTGFFSLWNLAGDLALMRLNFNFNFELKSNGNCPLPSGLGTRSIRTFKISLSPFLSNPHPPHGPSQLSSRHADLLSQPLWSRHPYQPHWRREVVLPPLCQQRVPQTTIDLLECQVE